MLQKKIKIEDLIIKQSNAFTLAEVLLTLGIIGVVAALTIPTTVFRAQQKEYKIAAKKAYSILANAIKLTEVQTGISADLFLDANAPGVVGQTFSQELERNLNIAKVVDKSDTHRVFYTADGFRWHYNPKHPNRFSVDVNGDKPPTTIDSQEPTSATGYGDWDDLMDPEWANVILSDMFVIDVRDANGRTRIVPNDDYMGWF